MMEAISIQISRQEGEESRYVNLSIQADGSLRLHASDVGPTVKGFWNCDEYEFWVDVPPEALRKLLAALLREKYLGRRDAVDEFRTFCEKETIAHEWDSWTDRP
jgi:hypothetical protein